MFFEESADNIQQSSDLLETKFSVWYEM